MLGCRKMHEREAAGAHEGEEFVFGEMQIDRGAGRARRVGR